MLPVFVAVLLGFAGQDVMAETTPFTDIFTTLAQDCSSKDDCPHLAYCDTSLAKCLCYLGYQWQNESCTRIPPQLGVHCTGRCGKNAHCELVHSRCACDDDYIFDSDHLHCTRQHPTRVGEHCALRVDQVSSCGANARCGQDNFRCACDKGYITSANGVDCELAKQPLEKRCATDNQCGLNAVCDLESSRCECPEYHIEAHNGIDCVTSHKQCSYQYQCGQNGDCNSQTNLCQCYSGYQNTSYGCRSNSHVNYVAIGLPISGGVVLIFLIVVVWYRRRRAKMIAIESSEPNRNTSPSNLQTTNQFTPTSELPVEFPRISSSHSVYSVMQYPVLTREISSTSFNPSYYPPPYEITSSPENQLQPEQDGIDLPLSSSDTGKIDFR